VRKVQKDKPTVFVSYNHNSKVTAGRLVELLENIADVYWDVSLEEWESFKSFMGTIRKQDYAVLIISEEYLKSRNCQYEVLKLMEAENWREKSMFVVEDSARSIYNINNRAQYVDYWAEQKNELEKEGKKHNYSMASHYKKEIEIYNQITYKIGDFLEIVADSNNPDVDSSINAIVDRLSIAAKKNDAKDIKNMILYLIENGISTPSDLAMILNRSESTIRKYLRILVTEEKIVIMGRGDNVFTHLKKEYGLQKAINESDKQSQSEICSKEDVDKVDDWIQSLLMMSRSVSLQLENSLRKSNPESRAEGYKVFLKQLSELSNAYYCRRDYMFSVIKVNAKNSLYKNTGKVFRNYMEEIHRIGEKYLHIPDTSEATEEISALDTKTLCEVKKIEKKLIVYRKI